MRTGRPKAAVPPLDGERQGAEPLQRSGAGAGGRVRDLGTRAVADAPPSAIAERWDVLCSHLHKCRCCVARG